MKAGLPRNAAVPEGQVYTRKCRKYSRAGVRETHPYLRFEFWNQPRNRFWECDSHTQASKDYFNRVHPIAN